MPDYIYLLENRLSADQRHALAQLRTAARDAGFLLFLTGDAVRDLTSGHAVRELEFAVQGNALKLKKPLEKLGGKLWGDDEPSRSLYLCFPGTVRANVISTHRVDYPKPGKPVYHPASIHEDLRRRDFTVNSMAISLNEGSYGLLMDPLNGAADIEARVLRLVSNYGFIEDVSLLIRAVRYRARLLGWEMDPRTQARYDSAKSEGVIEYLSPHARRQELEQIGHEEDGLKVLRALEAEGWMKVLFPAWTSAKADEAKLTALHELAVQLLLQGIHPDMSAAQMRLLTAKLPSKDLSALKKSMLRPGFVAEWNNLDSLAAGFAKALLAKQNAKPSASFKLFMSYDPEAILWLGFTSKDKAVQERYNNFLKVWPEARQHIPHALMQELRITPELPNYAELVQKIFLELIDGRLTTPEEMRAYLEPHSPPAPPPQVTIKRPRVRRSEARLKEQALEEEDEAEESLSGEEELEPIVADDEELDLGVVLPKGALALDIDEEAEGEEEKEEREEEDAEAVPAGKRRLAAAATAKRGQKPVPAAKPAQAKPSPPAAPAKPVPAKVQPPAAVKTAPKPVPAKTAKPATTAKPAAKAPAPSKTKAKTSAKKPAKAKAKAPARKAAKHAPAKAARHKPKPKPAAKPVRKAAAKPSKKPTAKKPAPKKPKKR